MIEMYPSNCINADTSDMAYLRNVLHFLYNSSNYFEEIKSYLSNCIDCNSIIYYPASFAIQFKIKKTSMKKIKNFVHTPEFYYNTFINAFYTFIDNNRNTIYNLLKKVNKEYILDKVDSNKLLLYNICNITCIDDDIIFITL